MIAVKSFYASRPIRSERDRDVILTRVVPVTILRSGLLQTELTHQEVKEFGDEHQNFRDYSLQTLLQVQAVDLLKPFGTIPVSKFTALDSADSAFVSIGDYKEKVDVLNAAAEAAAASDKEIPSSDVVEPSKS